MTEAVAEVAAAVYEACKFPYIDDTVGGASPEVADWDPDRHTIWADVTPSPQSVLFMLKWSKTRQHSNHSAVIPLPALGNTSPLLLATGVCQGEPVTIPKFWAAFRAGLSDKGLTSHSLRRGGATFSYRAGVKVPHIKTHGTWLSGAVNTYLLSQPKFNTPVAINFTKLLKDFKL